MTGIIFSILGTTVAVFCSFKAGYCWGRADGIKWAKDVNDGKYDDEIMDEFNGKK